MFLLFDLSQKDVRVMRPGGEETLPFVDLERNFPTKIYKIFEKFPEAEDVFVINGPGSFTTLRIGCLCLNLMQLWRKRGLRFYATNKVNLYQYAYQQNILPQSCVMWIGQSKNVWQLDLKSGVYEKQALGMSLSKDRDDCCMDTSITKMDGVGSGEIILGDSRIIELSIIDNELMLDYNHHTLSLQNYFKSISVKEFLEPEYMVEI